MNAANSVVVIGGMDRMESLYVEEAESRGIDLKVFLKPTPDLASRIGTRGRSSSSQAGSPTGREGR